MKASTKRIFSLLMSLVFSVAALIIYVNLDRPSYKVIQDLRGKLAAKTILLNNQKNIVSKVQNLLAQFKGAPQLQETVSLILPRSEEIASIFQQIQAISYGSGLSIQSFGIKPLSFKSKELGTFQITLKLIGNYSGVKSFLRAIETNVRIMDLVSLTIEQTNSKANQDIYSHTVVLNSYYQQ